MFKQSDVEATKYNDYKYLIYTRVSSDKDSQKESVPNQIDICRYWLEQNNYEFNEKSVLIDEDKSGTLFLERTAMQLILQKARNREIKMILFKSIHRLARDLKDALEIKEVLLGHGVRVVTIEEGYDSYVEGKNDMKFEMFSMFAAQYPKSLSVSISSALAAKVRRGEHMQQVKQLENSIAKYQEKSEGLVDLCLDKLIDKVEFQVRRKEFEQQIKEAQDKLFLYKNEEVQEVSVKNIQQAFKTIEKKDQDLYHVLKVIIEYITVNIDGSVDIKYNFDLNK
nr:recombinase family protein [Virgibacillus pantothenticus]